MQFFKLALLAAGASAMAIEERASNEWKVTNFSSEHIPHSSAATTSFIAIGPWGKTECNHSKPSQNANGLAHFSGVKCDNEAVSFGVVPTKNHENTWIVTMHFGRQLAYYPGQPSYFESPKGTGMTWERLDIPKKFTMIKED